jgi:hypothetical protein
MEVVVSSTAMWRVRIPVLLEIHSSDVSINLERSSFVTILLGRQLPVPIIFIL